ncbi:F-box protein At5g07610-like [Lotus japonicus]|uniref:F-box protein At5g07610-like n=1 Tax=Lotus japonicus TaxID=34305 RepID=UPI002588B3A7|nr:F-box protein At5g07610-like [Lotus japonicus]
MQISSLSSAEEVAGSTDILWGILLRVPLKSLHRLKVVSKRWLTLISNQRFRKSHSLHHHPRPTSLIFSDGGQSLILSLTTTTTPTLSALNLDFLNQPEVNVVRSCNGFLLCSSDSGYFVCNPITRDFTTLTLSNHPFKNKTKHLYLAFDPSISPHYKVISVVQWDDKWVFHKYSFKPRSWVSPRVSFFTTLYAPYDGVYCNRAIHWCKGAEFFVYFNVDTMQLRKLPVPLFHRDWDPVWLYRYVHYFGEAGGRLYLVLAVVAHFIQSDVYDIFEMKENYNGWSLKHRVNLRLILNMQGCTRVCTRRFTIVRPAKEEKSMLILLVTQETLILYDLANSRKLCELEIGRTTAAHIQSNLDIGKVFQYFENTAFVTDKADSTCQLLDFPRLLCCLIPQ